MATEAQILANQRNAQKSTGPRTLSMSLGLATTKRFAKTSAPEYLFMQNKANYPKNKMNANAFSQKDYEHDTAYRLQKYKPKQSQFLYPWLRLLFIIVARF